jgi:hypothetical protein
MSSMARCTANYKVAASTKAKLSQLAIQFGFVYGRGGWVGKLLDAIASGDIVLVRSQDLEKIKKNQKRGLT